MRKMSRMLVLSLTILICCLSCSEECDDCLELTSKNIKYIDSNGANLLFGNQATYNPDNVVVKAGNDNIINVWKQENAETISFNLEENYSDYFIVLSETLIDTIKFELTERKSITCCGNVIYSTKTFLNGTEIENNDLIVITH